MRTRWLQLAASAAVLALTLPLNAAEEDAERAEVTSIVQRFLASQPQAPRGYSAWRRLEASSRGGKMQGWLEAWTVYDGASAFRFEVADEGGSEYIRNRVLRAVLKGEQDAFRSGKAGQAMFAPANYEFTPVGSENGGLVKMLVKPRRKDVMLVDGVIFVDPASADLVRVEGAMAKNPSVWTRRVNVRREYDRVAGVQLPVKVESVAQIKFVGRATFSMTYSYQAVSGRQVRSSADARRQLGPVLAALAQNENQN